MFFNIIESVLHKFLMLCGWALHPLFRFIYENEKQPLPPINDDLLLKSGCELAKLIRSRKHSSREIVELFISRIKVINPILNMVVSNRFDLAREEATQIDRILDSGDIPEEFSITKAPYLGVPFTTKESISIKGQPYTSGLLKRKDVLADGDAPCISLMRKAGAIPLAQTNVSELCMWYESNNLVYGRSKNPYHQGKIVGGSSGGEGCIQSAAASPIGIGSDIGGSIRMPSYFNGVFGHKATTGIVDVNGQWPMAVPDVVKLLSVGPICRYACDLLPIMKILVLPEFEQKLCLDKKVDVKKLKFYFMEGDGGESFVSPVHPSIVASINKAIAHFKSLGCKTQKVCLKQFKKSLPIWINAMHSKKYPETTFCLEMGNMVQPVKPFYELLLWLLQFPRHTLPGIMLGIFEKLTFSDKMADNINDLGISLLKDLEELLGEDGVFLYPTHPLPAVYHNEPLVKCMNFSYTAIFNVLGLPSTTVPMGLDTELKVPVGFQVVSAKYRDRLNLAVAEELEKVFGGWVPPT